MGGPTKRQQINKKIGEAVSKMTPDTVQKLKDAFAVGANIQDACDYAEISKQTYYNWLERDPELLDQIRRMQAKLPLKSHKNIASKIDGGDVELSKWFLERKRPDDFNPKVKIEHTAPITDISDPETASAVAELTRQHDEALRKLLIGTPPARKQKVVPEEPKQA